ncbi:Thioredoxin-like fold domain-containing protein [Rozella allomycis CSF55]|uniref:protein disulfide-isomerase n=1 Tax=Rozella allomycis (strain CSF55) TaxID=988480 RepID=A0A075ASG8_ROZAC|nr:Thioredoxin-like fold domain-containing protein [Rozella allomycis CSF55]|eukprot:EPZ33203.1 Thioredoxin-like fold domain-containing protein [Rozella allomycis CSF55]
MQPKLGSIDKFQDFIFSEENMLVEFYDQNELSEKLTPRYDEAASILKHKSRFAQINCDEQTTLCYDLGINRYPTLILFQNGNFTEYKGERSVEGIVSFMTKMLRETPVKLTESTFDDFKKEDNVVVIGFFPDGDEKAQVFRQIAEEFKPNISFGLVNEEGLPEKKGEKVGSVVVYTSFEPYRFVYSDDLNDKKSLAKFIENTSTSFLEEFSSYYYGDELLRNKKPVGYIFVESEKQKMEMARLFKDVVKKYRGEVFILINDYDANTSKSFVESLGLPVGIYPSLAFQESEIQYTRTKTKYIYKGKFEQKPIDEFIKSIVDKTAVPFLKSAPLPTEGPADLVKIIVNKNYNDIVLDKSKHVFVIFDYTLIRIGSVHCKILKPVWQNLAEDFSNRLSNVVIAKMDGTENDLPLNAGFELVNYPTLSLFPAGSDKTPVEYNGERDLNSLKKFINSFLNSEKEEHDEI